MSTNLNNTTPAAPAGGMNVKWQTDGSGNDSAYVPAGASAGVNSQTANYLAVAGDSGKLISMSSGSAITLTLPASPPSVNWVIAVENVGAGTLTISRNGLNIDGAASNLTASQNQGVIIYTDGSNYFTTRGMGSGGGGGVTSLNSLTGALNITAGSGITVTPSGSNIQVASTSGTPPVAQTMLFDTMFSFAPASGTMTVRYGPDTWTTLGSLFNIFTAASATNVPYATYNPSAAANPGGGYSTMDSGQFSVWSPTAFSVQFQTIMAVSQISDCLFYAGFFDRSSVGGTFAGTTVGNTRGCYFRFDTSASDTKIQCITANGTTKTTTSSGVSMDTHSHYYAIYHNSTEALFYIDGSLVATNTTNLPTSSPNPGWQVSVAYVTTANSLFVNSLHVGLGV